MVPGSSGNESLWWLSEGKRKLKLHRSLWGSSWAAVTHQHLGLSPCNIHSNRVISGLVCSLGTCWCPMLLTIDCMLVNLLSFFNEFTTQGSLLIPTTSPCQSFPYSCVLLCGSGKKIYVLHTVRKPWRSITIIPSNGYHQPLSIKCALLLWYLFKHI